jgi:hypothetical protein
MKTEAKAGEMKNFVLSARSLIYLQILGLPIFMIAYFFSSEEIIYMLLLFIGAAALTEVFKRTRLQHKLKEIVE